MSYKRFNRHEIFNSEMMSFHSQTIREVEDFFIENDESMFNQLTNMLCGIWDGYLYDNLMDVALEMGIHNGLIDRIEQTIEFIEKNIKEKELA